MVIDVKFDGRIYTARQRGGAGYVFGDTAAEALRRAATWNSTHFSKASGATPWKKKRVPEDGLGA